MECQLSIEKVKGQGHRTSKTSRNCRMSGGHVYLRGAIMSMPERLRRSTTGRTAAYHVGADVYSSLKCAKFFYGRGSAPDPTGWAYEDPKSPSRLRRVYPYPVGDTLPFPTRLDRRLQHFVSHPKLKSGCAASVIGLYAGVSANYRILFMWFAISNACILGIYCSILKCSRLEMVSAWLFTSAYAVLMGASKHRCKPDQNGNYIKTIVLENETKMKNTKNLRQCMIPVFASIMLASFSNSRCCGSDDRRPLANYSFNYFRTNPTPIRTRYINVTVTDRQTDGRTTCDSNTALALRASRDKNGRYWWQKRILI